MDILAILPSGAVVLFDAGAIAACYFSKAFPGCVIVVQPNNEGQEVDDDQEGD